MHVPCASHGLSSLSNGIRRRKEYSHTIICWKSQLLQVAIQHCLKQLLNKSGFPTQTLWENCKRMGFEVQCWSRWPPARLYTPWANSWGLMIGQSEHSPFLWAGSASLWDTASSSPNLMPSFFSLRGNERETECEVVCLQKCVQSQLFYSANHWWADLLHYKPLFTTG